MKKKRYDILLWLLLGALVIGALWGGITLLNQRKLYTDNADTERVRREAVVSELETIYTNFDKNFLRKIDFEVLRQTNAQATRWIYVPNTAIDDAIVQEKTVGKYEYLWNGLDGKYNGSGSYMVPAAPINPETGEMYEDDHLMVLGHRMKSSGGEWKFSHIPKRWGHAQGAKDYPYVYIYHEDRVERYRVWSFGQDVKGSGTSSIAHNPEYLTPYEKGTEDYEAMLRYVERRAHYTVGRAPSMDDKTLMMSTCNTAHASGGRSYLTAVLDAEYIYATEEVIEYE